MADGAPAKEAERVFPGYADPLLVDEPAGSIRRRPRRRWASLWRVGNGLAWLGGADWREIGDRSERSAYQVSGFFVALNAMIAWAMMTFAAVGAAGVHPAAALPFTVLWGLFVGAFDRAISAKIADPQASRWRNVSGFVIRGVFTVVLGVIVAEAAALTIFANSIERTLGDNIQRQIDESQNLVTGVDERPSSRSEQLTNLEKRRAALDTTVADAQRDYDQKALLARCEFEPRPECPDIPLLTGDPGPGPETRARNDERDAAATTLQTARSRVSVDGPALDTQIADLRRNIAADQKKAAQDARGENGIDARWRAMHDYTTASWAALLLRLGLALGLIFLDLVPLLLKVLRGRSTHDERVLAKRQRTELAVREHTKRYADHLRHTSVLDGEVLAEERRREDIRRTARLQCVREVAETDVRIEQAHQERRYERQVRHEETRTEPGGTTVGVPSDPTEHETPEGPSAAAEVPEWWSQQDARLIGRRFGSFEAVGALDGADRGGFGRLLIGRHHEDPGRWVVIKAVAELEEPPRRRKAANRMKPRQSPTRKMWDAEVDSARELHPHAAIAEVLEHGQDYGYLWIASPRYSPGSLVRWLEDLDRRHRTLTLDRAFAFIDEVVNALAYAHSCNRTHGDIKPHNIVLDGPQPLLVDWGLARAVQQAKADLSGVRPAGTKYYTAPEAFLPGDEWRYEYADIWSIGATWYYLLTGAPPFDAQVGEDGPGAVDLALMIQHREVQPTPLMTLLPDLPHEIAELVHRLLSPVARDRTNVNATKAASKLLHELRSLKRALAQGNMLQTPVGESAVEAARAQSARIASLDAPPVPRGKPATLPRTQLATTEVERLEDEGVHAPPGSAGDPDHLPTAIDNGDVPARRLPEDYLPSGTSGSLAAVVPLHGNGVKSPNGCLEPSQPSNGQSSERPAGVGTEQEPE